MMLPGVRKTIFICSLRSFPFVDTHCTEKHFIAFGVECFLTIHVT